MATFFYFYFLKEHIELVHPYFIYGISQIDIYNEALGSFGTPTARRAIMKSFPGKDHGNFIHSTSV